MREIDKTRVLRQGRANVVASKTIISLEICFYMCYPRAMAKHNIKKEILNFNTIFREEKEGGFSVSVPVLPGCYSQGETLEETIKNIREAIVLYLEGEDAIPETDDAREFIVPVSVHG